jgi:hypothetical protein
MAKSPSKPFPNAKPAAPAPKEVPSSGGRPGKPTGGKK